MVQPDNGILFITKKNELLGHEKTMGNKCILLNERTQSEKTTCYMIPTI